MKLKATLLILILSLFSALTFANADAPSCYYRPHKEDIKPYRYPPGLTVNEYTDVSIYSPARCQVSNTIENDEGSTL